MDPPPVAAQGRRERNGARAKLALPDGPPLEGSGVDGGYDPQDLRSAYDIPATGGADQTIALVDAYGYPEAEANLAKYRDQYGLAPCTTASGCFRKVNQVGEEANYPAVEGGWQVESALDLDMASAACPECHILLVEATTNETTNLDAAVNTAARLGATEISNSYGSPEEDCRKFVSECEAEAAAFDHPGVLITVSAGDSGYDDHYGGHRSPEVPASLPTVVAVGGTALHRAQNARGWSEEPWNEPQRGSGGGSGCSRFAKPVWQGDSACAGRMTVDVAAVAACETPVSVYVVGDGEKGWTLICGTSASSPLVAGIEAHATAYARSLPGADAFYSDPAAFHDVTSGSNGTCTPPAADEYFCHAEVGYDGPTGNGTPDGPLEITSASPIARTTPVSAVSPTAATLNGMLDPQGAETSYHFEYGTTSAYEHSVPVPDASAGTGTAAEQVSREIAGLSANTIYHYRLVATNATGVSYGKDSAFLTAPPVVSGVESASGPIDGGETVTITGTGFVAVTAVRFGSSEAASFTVNSETTLTATVPLGRGTVDVTVSTPAGTSPTSAADRFTYALTADVLAWGSNSEGALGDGTEMSSTLPVEVQGLSAVSSLAAGGDHAVAGLANGEAVAWGENSFGQLGDGSRIQSSAPVKVCAAAGEEEEPECPEGPYLQEVKEVAAAPFFSLALLGNGTVVSWGYGVGGELGNGFGISTRPRPVCAQFPCKALKEVVGVAASNNSSLALLRDGQVMSWGTNEDGALGNGKRAGSERCGGARCERHANPISGLKEVVAISASASHSLALLKNGTVMAWGSGEWGDLGDGKTATSYTPVLVCAPDPAKPSSCEKHAPLREVRAVAAGGAISLALMDNGTVMAWGLGGQGALGQGTLTGPETCSPPERRTQSCSLTPVQVKGLSEAKTITAGNDTGLAVLDNGELEGWGSNYSGNLGDGTEQNSDLPTPVCAATAPGPCPEGPYLSGEVTALASGLGDAFVGFTAPPSG